MPPSPDRRAGVDFEPPLEPPEEEAPACCWRCFNEPCPGPENCVIVEAYYDSLDREEDM